MIKAAKKSAGNSISILGKPSVKSQMELLKNTKLDGVIKNALRQCLITAMNFESNTKENFKKSKTIIKKNKDDCEILSRAALFATANAIKLNRLEEASEMISFSKCSPPTISTSLKVIIFSKQGKLNEALNEIENILMFEEKVFGSCNYSISDEALDTLCEAIKSSPDSTFQIKRFRNLQRIITKYGKRTTKSIEELLYSPIRVETFENEKNNLETLLNTEKMDKLIRKLPYLE